MSFYVEEPLSIGQAIYEAALIIAILRWIFCFLFRFIKKRRSQSSIEPEQPSSSSSSSWDDNNNNNLLVLTTFGEMLERVPETEDTCAVCLNELKMQDQVRELMNCYHVFHRECIDRWLDHDRDTCPLCRAPLLSSNYCYSSETDPSSTTCVPPPQPSWAVESLLYLFGDDLLPY